MSSSPQQPILITLDGNIGAGKSTLLKAIHERFPHLTVIQEPVGEWLTMKSSSGESLLELFYKDTPRWAYTFQNCAILTRLIDTLRILKEWRPVEGKLPIIITERSVLTDRHVFADMLYSQGKMDLLEWNLYLKWYNAFAAELPIRGIIHLATSVGTSADRIKVRGREGEGGIPVDYLAALDAQHAKWIAESALPTLSIDTEPSTALDDVLARIDAWITTTFATTTATSRGGQAHP
jgi:deoxyadenosine/deoxycytidine kinase